MSTICESPVARRALNGADRFLLQVDRSLRRLGSCGFETQTFVWLNGRLDARQLAADLAALGRRYPVISSRLVEQGGPYWRLRPGTTVSLRENSLASAEAQAVLGHAGRLLSTVTDPAEVDPIRFHLLHLPDGRDVFLLQFNHSLIDHGDAVALLRQLANSSIANHVEPAVSQAPWLDPIWHYLRRFPKEHRRAAATAVDVWRKTLRGGGLILGQQHTGEARYSYRILTGRLEPAATAALQSNVVRTCGVPSLSMTVLASAFRAVDRLAESKPGNYLHTGIGVDLGLSRGGVPALQNLTTLVPIRVDRGELADRDALARLLNHQFREKLSQKIDLGVLELATVFGRQPEKARWILDLLFRYCISLWYGSFGMLRLGPEFRGVPIDAVYSAGPAWSPAGLTLLINQFAGRLHLQVTYVPECVSDSQARAFLDAVLNDLPTDSTSA